MAAELVRALGYLPEGYEVVKKSSKKPQKNEKTAKKNEYFLEKLANMEQKRKELNKK